jgi:hypothetical protein
LIPVYVVNQPVEWNEGEGWARGVVADVDTYDSTYPYRVRVANGDLTWVKADQIRPLGPIGPRMQYRTRIGHAARGARFTEWTALEPGMRVNLDGAWGLETREQPYRTDAEIVTALRKYTDEQCANGIICDDKFADILGGTF